MHRLRIATWATLAGVGLALGCASSRNTCNSCDPCCTTARAPFWQRWGHRDCCPAECPCSTCGAGGAPCTTCSGCGGGAVGTLLGNEGPILEDPGAFAAVPGGVGGAPLSPAPMTTLPGAPPAQLGQPSLPIAPTPRLDQPPLAQPIPSEPSSRRRLTSR